MTQPETTAPSNVTAINSVGSADYERALRLVVRLGPLLDLAALAEALVGEITAAAGSARALLLVADETGERLRAAGSSAALRTAFIDQRLLDGIIDTLTATDSPLLDAWHSGQTVRLRAADANGDAALGRLARATAAACVLSQPLMADGRLTGVLILLADDAAAVNGQTARLLELAAPGLGCALNNARAHSQMVAEAAARTRQLYILGQIDRELNETINLSHVFDMTLDWALRYTNAQCASLALYNEATGDLHYVAGVGYELPLEQLAAKAQRGQTTAHRVARAGRPELIPDVSTDKDYLRLSPLMRSLLCAPILREDRVVAVINVESRRLNGFTDTHTEFVEKLGARAGVAIDNARLFSETAREREKLSRILDNTADGVLVATANGAIELINPSARSAAGLNPTEDYAGRQLADVLRDTPLPALFEKARASGKVTVGEVRFQPGRTHYVNMSSSPELGWIIVMHDISSLKETERLKNELVSTVSHDLKQPLSVMHGYTELILMHEPENPDIETFTRMIQSAIGGMRQLIDDLLDLSRLEAGVELRPTAVYLRSIVNMCVEGLYHPARKKALEVTSAFSDGLPPVAGEQRYLHQIFMNLIGNAVKYTPANGHIRICAEANAGMVRVTIEDDGLGISPEDQARIFDRFFRVRRAETDGIEGTGLGLAIVKRLVELHGGHIGLSSRLGEGTTFYVTLPVYLPPEPAP